MQGHTGSALTLCLRNALVIRVLTDMRKSQTERSCNYVGSMCCSAIYGFVAWNIVVVECIVPWGLRVCVCLCLSVKYRVH